MKLKLTKTQLEGLLLIVNVGLNIEPEDIPERLVALLMEKFADRLTKKVKKVRTRTDQTTSMTINDQEALTLYCWYQHVSEQLRYEYAYEVMVADRLFNDIDREYA
ncbi:MAG: hypothetical protein RIC03_06830 [Cyclobacteriaceae bacterium]